ncbi:MAG: hypothetical protein U9N78_02030 [Actinomycetota bacterium]|nr:hypothetical protein [Actinomycetota bacterium]
MVPVDAVGAIPDGGIGRIGHAGEVTTEVQVRRVIRRSLVGALVVVAVTACSSDESSTTESAPTASPAPTTTLVSTASTTDAPTTTTVGVTTTSTAATATPTYELGVWAAPADGQWFAELPIPWVFPVWPEQEDPPREADGVPGAMGWVQDPAPVTVNGVPTETEWCHSCMGQPGDVLMWRTVSGEGDSYNWQGGKNLVVIEATFEDGVVVREERLVHYDPALDAFTGWIVELDRHEPSVTFAAATFESADDDGTDVGPVTSVVEYPIRDDAVFILLDPDSSGQPPASVIDFDEFIRLLDASEEGCPPSGDPWENQCFFASGLGVNLFSSPDEPGYPFVIYITEDGEVQQLEQTWGP